MHLTPEEEILVNTTVSPETVASKRAERKTKNETALTAELDEITSVRTQVMKAERVRLGGGLQKIEG